MRELDIKLLWGRSGNRCAICKLELSPNGDEFTLGEMAHIVARSIDGPRGGEDLSLEVRDQYSNLILLCPTHHSEIDKDLNTWSVSKLRAQKSEHELWVSSQLGQGRITVLPVDNRNFLRDREIAWKQFCKEQVWAVASVTPLSIYGDVIDPLSNCFRRFFSSLRVPRFEQRPDPLVQPVNRRLTRPSPNGLVSEDLRNLSGGNGHRMEVFRNGHCEYLICLQGSVDQITGAMKESRGDSLEAERVIRYTDLAVTIKNQLENLSALWKECLPFRDMTVTWMMINCSMSIMYSHETRYKESIVGFAVEETQLLYREVVNLVDHPVLVERTLKRAVNSFGLVLDTLFDSDGDWRRPNRLIW